MFRQPQEIGHIAVRSADDHGFDVLTTGRDGEPLVCCLHLSFRPAESYVWKLGEILGFKREECMK